VETQPMTVQITALDHVNLRAPHAMFERLRAFYRDVIGLDEGPRPDFGSEGAWMYAGGRPVIHLSVTRPVDADAKAASRASKADASATRVIDHVAFQAAHPEAAAQHLRQHGVNFVASRSEVTRQHQYFLFDPAGNGVELNFPYGD
jgi:4-hydroxyphenylpyruvate dioxygenase-like putative hemolysin